MVKAILFDLFETLVTERDTIPTRAGSLGPAFGLEAVIFRKTWKPYRPRVIRGELSFAAALAEIVERLGAKVDASAIERMCEMRVREKAAVFQQVDPALMEMIKTLHAQGIRLAVVSNCFPEDIQRWADCSLQPYFQSTMFSCATGMAKPESAIYLEALRQLKVAPADALFIGDGGDGELEGAARAGIRAVQACWYETGGKCRSLLTATSDTPATTAESHFA